MLVVPTMYHEAAAALWDAVYIQAYSVISTVAVCLCQCHWCVLWTILPWAHESCLRPSHLTCSHPAPHHVRPVSNDHDYECMINNNFAEKLINYTNYGTEHQANMDLACSLSSKTHYYYLINLTWRSHYITPGTLPLILHQQHLRSCLMASPTWWRSIPPWRIATIYIHCTSLIPDIWCATIENNMESKKKKIKNQKKTWK